MRTIRKRLSILFVICSISAILLVTLFVNVTIGKKFNQYMTNNQTKTYERVISHFEEIYKREGMWTKNSGIELMHDAYMGNYCLTLLDSSKNFIWGMDPNSIKSNFDFTNMPREDKGLYQSKRFEIKVDKKIVGYVDIGQYSSILLSEEDINFKKSVNESIIASGIITLVIFIVVSLYISKQFSRPIKDVVNMSVNLSKGNFNTKSNIKSNIKELEYLRESINFLAEKLKSQDMLRRRLISDISHEIRTPLNILQNNLEAMIDGLFPATKDRLNYLNEEVIRFGKLLNNLNTLKEFETESIKLNFETILLDKITMDIYNDFYLAAENKKIKLYCNIDEEKSYRITGDKDKLKQVLINLISNAIKFTEEGGLIIINLYAKNKNVILEVNDNGIGINKRDLPFIFERLYRGDKSRHQFEGNGIGLTIAKNILELHNAEIEAESEEGRGSTFKVKFNKVDLK